MFVYSLKNGIVENGREEIFTKQKKVIKEITAQTTNPKIDQVFSINVAKKIHGSVAYFSLSSLENIYGHFWCEYIGQIYLLWKSKIKPDFYIFTQELPFQAQFVDLICKVFDIPKNKVLKFPVGTIIKADTLIFTSLLNSSKLIKCGERADWNKIYLPSFIKNIYKMLADFVPANTLYGEKIYISRAGEKTFIRKTTNEKDVQELVKKYGFCVIKPEDFTVEEQIAIFKNAKYLIATNGSGIAPFFITQKQNAKLLVLYPEFFPDTHFKILSSICGVDFNYIRCKTSLKDTKGHIKPNQDNLTVDLDGVKIFLDSL